MPHGWELQMCVHLAMQLEPVQINYDPFKLGFDYQPNVLDWGTLGALELTCPDVAFNQSQGEPEQDPGPLPSDLAPLGE